MDSQANELATSLFGSTHTIANHKQFFGQGSLVREAGKWNPRYSICLLFSVIAHGLPIVIFIAYDYFIH